MTLGGWINMIASVGFVTAFTVWCVWRVTRGKSEKIHSQVDIHPPNEQP